MDAYRHVQRLELAWFEDQSTGGLLSILNDDVNQLERFLDIGANELVRTLVNVVFVGVVFFVAEPVLGRRGVPAHPAHRVGVGPLPAPARAPLHRGAPGGRRPRRAPGQQRVGHRHHPLVHRRGARVRPGRRRQQRLPRGQPGGDQAVVGVHPAHPHGDPRRVHGDADRRRPGGARTARWRSGVFSVLVYMTQRLLWPLTRLGETFDLYQRAMASTRRILDLLAVDPTIVGRAQAPCRRRCWARCGSSRSCGSRYGAGRRRRPAGARRVRPRGAAGRDPRHRRRRPGRASRPWSSCCCGSTTPQDGRITLDGVAVDDVPLAELRRAIGYVGQDVFLFQGTVRENLAYGRPDAEHRRGAGAGRPAGRGARLHRRAARRLRHGRRRAGPEAVGRPAPAAVDRPGHPQGPADARARRGDLRGRQRDRGRHPALARAGRPRADA